MADVSYYIVFSVIAVILIILHFINIIYFRVKGKTVLGEEVKTDMPGYNKLKKFSSPRGIAIAAVLGLGAVTNLIYAASRVMELGDSGYAQFILIYVPAGVALFCIIMFFATRNKFR